jgi:uncharacterized protein DUF3574
MASALGLAVALALSTCTTASLAACRGNQESMLAAELLFGRKIGNRGIVSEAEWARFVAREITPRFPEGLTVFDAAGQWRDPRRGAIVREPSKVVLIVFRDEAGKQEHLTAIADAYKRRFNQQSVGIVIKPACASF